MRTGFDVDHVGFWQEAQRQCDRLEVVGPERPYEAEAALPRRRVGVLIILCSVYGTPPNTQSTGSYRIVILTNQGGLILHPDPNSKAPKRNSTERVSNFKQKANAVLTQLDMPLTLYGATGKDIFRKPRTGMWQEMCKDYGLDASTIDRANSIFVGDAGGRKAYLKGGKAVPKDFSCSDRNLAENIGIPFKTPEEFFLGEEPRDFARDFDLINFPFAGESEDIKFEKRNDQELVLFCGPPGAGKSTFFWKHLKPLGFERVNQDLLKRSAIPTPSCLGSVHADRNIARTNASKLLPSSCAMASPS